jgi:hypothetical protein
MEGSSTLVVALLVVAIVFSVVSVSLIIGLADLNFTKPNTAVAGEAIGQGNRVGNVNLEVLNAGGTP